MLHTACDACHLEGGSGASYFLYTEEEASLVDVPSSTGLNYVEVGDPDLSYLYLKLTGRQAEADGGGGSTMPLGTALPDSSLSTLAAWITNGDPA